MKSPVIALGIDIAKLKFDVCLIKENGRAKHKVFQNNQHGFGQPVAWLGSHQASDLHACLEATGSYGEPLALFLFEAGFLVSLVNPAAVRAFANAGLSRTKTDKADAELIARFCLAQRPKAWQPPAPELRELQALVRRLESLIEMRVAEENRLSSGVSAAAVKQSLEEHIAYLVEQIKRAEALIRQHITNHPDLKEQSDLPRLDSGNRRNDRRAAACRDCQHQTIHERAAGRRLRRTGAARAAVGQFRQRARLFIKNRQCATSQVTLFSGNHGSQMQRLFQSVGGTVTDARQIKNVGDRGGDEKVDSLSLRSHQDRQAV